MARREPATAAQSGAARKRVRRLSAADLDELVMQAKVPKSKREACASAITECFDFYNDRIARKNAPSEASQAESLRLVADAARQLYRLLTSLPPFLRSAVEPDYPAYVKRIEKAAAVAEAEASAAAWIAAATDPNFQKPLPKDAGLPPTARQRELMRSQKLSSRARAALPLELVLAALIERADC